MNYFLTKKVEFNSDDKILITRVFANLYVVKLLKDLKRCNSNITKNFFCKKNGNQQI
ncbi:hypothetical protein BafACA1_G26 (plasmid) [Borreliella afzelii ACA-1]|nr:hypothetical protein BafACA1_G26 [Borreliella afzelii ACA-1]AJY72996.1 hypothetical protein BAFK78_G021 [Borreliella afzelii K78]